MAGPQSFEDHILEITREIVDEERAAQAHLARAAHLKARLAAVLQGLRDAVANAAAIAANRSSERQLEAAEEEAQTLGGRVLSLLLSNPGEYYDANGIAEKLALPAEKLPTLRTVLNRLHGRKMIGNPHRGVYSAAREAAPK